MAYTQKLWKSTWGSKLLLQNSKQNNMHSKSIGGIKQTLKYVTNTHYYYLLQNEIICHLRLNEKNN